MNFYINCFVKGNNVYLRGVENGKRFSRIIKNYKPYLFVKSNKTTSNLYKTLYDEPVQRMDFNNLWDARNYIEQYKGTNAKIYGTTNFEEQYISEAYKGHITFDRQHLKVFNIDIETDINGGFPEPALANNAITAITVKDSNKGKFFVFGCKDYNNTNPNVKYVKCQNEKHLLENFLKLWTYDYPDIITGWNIRFFDIPYIINRITKVLGPEQANKLSVWGQITKKTIYVASDPYDLQEIVGISSMDYLDLYKKYTSGNKESYSLNSIANYELGQGKIAYTGSLDDLYESDYQKFIDYNIQDVNLVDLIDEKMKLIDLHLDMMYIAKAPNTTVCYGPVRYWEILLYNHLLEKNIVINPKDKKEDKSEQYIGAYVKETTPGLYNWVVSCDLESLYPSIVMQWNISPETLITSVPVELEALTSKVTIDKLVHEEIDLSLLKKYDYSMTANGALYRKDKYGILPTIFKELFDGRKIAKKEMIECKKKLEVVKEQLSHGETKELLNEKESLVKKISALNNRQMCLKICLNSAYGAIGNQGFAYYNIKNAVAITSSGQMVIKTTEKETNKMLNQKLNTNHDYVVGIDTDSVYLELEKFVDPKLSIVEKVNYLDKFAADELEPLFQRTYQRMFEYTNSYTLRMKMKREAIGEKAIWLAKKHYIISVWDNEGVRFNEPNIKMMGIEAVKSSTPAICRTKIKEAIKLILTTDNDTVIQFIDKFKEEFSKQPADVVAFPRGVSEMDKFVDNSNQGFKKGTPIHNRGAILHNQLLKKLGLKKIKPIGSKDKIKFLYLKEPNHIGQNVISFIGTLPNEFELDQYIDYNLQFEKTFLSPIKGILDAMNWQIEKSNSLDAFF